METLARPAVERDEAEWTEQARRHEARIRQWTDPHRDRAARGEKHPVMDFLFTYYSFRPAWLRQWHPGPGTILLGGSAEAFLRWPEYSRLERGIGLDPGRIGGRLGKFVPWLREFLSAVQARPAFFGCAGAHEWAMVYRIGVFDTERATFNAQRLTLKEGMRHPEWPLRFSSGEIADIVEALPVCCTHFDAFRFFTAAARPLNRVGPTRETAIENDQRGCLHANMDLYKWAFKLAPYAPSELVADCFELAVAIREVDMRASPYDLRALGYEPIRIETPEGRAEYERHQRGFAAKSEPLRSRLIALCDRLQSSFS